MSPVPRKILWADDEIDLLKPHVLLLESKGYRVTSVSNGTDAVACAAREKFDAVLLDESMPGLSGLATLEAIKSHDSAVPVVLVTKNEAESLMNEAIGRRIDDYLIKPVRPTQILLVLKRLLDSDRLLEGQRARDSVEELARIRADLSGNLDWRAYVDLYDRAARWDVEMDSVDDPGLKQAYQDQRRELNASFAQHVETRYEAWLRGDDPPPLSPRVVERWVAPHLRAGRQVFLIVVDCLRLDQWYMVEPLLRQHFDLELHHHLSILPTATPYARNAIFAGLFPEEIWRSQPGYWDEGGPEERSRNRHERPLLEQQIKRLGLDLTSIKYLKIFNPEEAANVRRNIATYKSIPLVAMVFNFLDMLTHGRSESDLLRELAPDEAAFRSVMRSWFRHSPLFDALKWIARQGAVVVLTTDHGAILSRHSALVHGNRETSTNLRFKFGTNLSCDPKTAVLVKDPARFRLPSDQVQKQYVIAKEDYYFVYPTRFHEYENKYRDTFQHGGISLEEMILPTATLTPRVSP
jgi:CheY-like chemotaxis protein